MRLQAMSCPHALHRIFAYSDVFGHRPSTPVRSSLGFFLGRLANDQIDHLCRQDSLPSRSSSVLFNPRNPPACKATAPTADSRLRRAEFCRDNLVGHAIRRHQHNPGTRNATRLRTAPRDHVSKVLRSSSDKVMTGAIFMSSILL